MADKQTSNKEQIAENINAIYENTYAMANPDIRDSLIKIANILDIKLRGDDTTMKKYKRIPFEKWVAEDRVRNCDLLQRITDGKYFIIHKECDSLDASGYPMWIALECDEDGFIDFLGETIKIYEHENEINWGGRQ